MGLNFLSRGASATEKSLTADISKLLSRRDDLKGQLAKHDSAIADHQAAAQQSLIEKGVEDVRSMAAAAECERLMHAINAAIATIDHQVAAKQTEHDDLIQRELAERIAKDLENEVSDFKVKMTAAIDALTALALASEAIADHSFIAGQVRDVARNLPHDFEMALLHIEEEARYHVAGLRNGSIKPKLPQAPAAAEAAKPKPEIARRVVFAMTELEWREGDVTRTSGKHAQVALPIPLADKAVRLGYCLEFSDPRVRSLSRGAVPAPMRNGTPLANGKLSAANADLDDPNLQPPRPIYGADRAAAEAGMHDSRGKSFVADGALTL